MALDKRGERHEDNGRKGAGSSTRAGELFVTRYASGTSIRRDHTARQRDARHRSAAISLIDDHRQWFKSRVAIPFTETPREQAFCTYPVASQQFFEVSFRALPPRQGQDRPLLHCQDAIVSCCVRCDRSGCRAWPPSRHGDRRRGCRDKRPDGGVGGDGVYPPARLSHQSSSRGIRFFSNPSSKRQNGGAANHRCYKEVIVNISSAVAAGEGLKRPDRKRPVQAKLYG